MANRSHPLLSSASLLVGQLLQPRIAVRGGSVIRTFSILITAIVKCQWPCCFILFNYSVLVFCAFLMYRWFDARLPIRVHSIVCICACLYILQQLQLWFCSCMCAETGPVFSTLYFSFTINIDLSMFELDFLAQYAIRRLRCQHLQQDVDNIRLFVNLFTESLWLQLHQHHWLHIKVDCDVRW